jgi:hypothetical protein
MFQREKQGQKERQEIMKQGGERVRKKEWKKEGQTEINDENANCNITVPLCMTETCPSVCSHCHVSYCSTTNIPASRLFLVAFCER